MCKRLHFLDVSIIIAVCLNKWGGQMKKRMLIVTQNLSEKHVSYIRSILPSSQWDIIIGKDQSIWEKHLGEAEIIVSWKKGMEEILHKHSKLKWLQSWTAGVNSLPLEKLKENQIIVTNASGVHAYPISETIFAYILGFTRKIHQYIRNQQEKTWHHAYLKEEVHEKTIGLIGVGAIGNETAKIAKAFNMKVLGVRHSGKDAEYVDKMYSPDKLVEVLPQCDYVVVSLPSTKETKQLFNKEKFSLMKATAIFINVGRGDTVHEADLINALKNNEIAGACLDVFEEEPLPTSSELWEMENVIITPHTAGSTKYYQERLIENIFLPNLKAYLNEESLPINLVDYTKGY